MDAPKTICGRRTEEISPEITHDAKSIPFVRNSLTYGMLPNRTTFR